MRNVNILDYLPSVISDTLEFQQLANAENPEIDSLWVAHEEVFNTQFIDALNEEGCRRWEKILKVSPMGTDTLADRRFRILTHLNAELPYTLNQLKNLLASLCGANGYTLELLNDEYKLIVRITLTAKKSIVDVEKMLKRVIPANLILDLSLLYNQYQTISGKTHGELAAYLHNQLREEVI